MRIGLLSDTHIPEIVGELPSQLEQVFHGVDLIMHAGDIYVARVLDELERLAPVIAAEGDDDYHETTLDKRVKTKHVLEIGGVTVWLTHERPALNTREKAPGVVVFGHTHRDAVENTSGTIFVNPGSLTFPGYRRRPGSAGILTVKSGKPEVQIIRFL